MLLSHILLLRYLKQNQIEFKIKKNNQINCVRVVQIVLNSNTKFVDVSNVRSDCVFIIDWNDFCECHHVFFFNLATIELFKFMKQEKNHHIHIVSHFIVCLN